MKPSEPILIGGTQCGGAAKRRVVCELISEVVFVRYSAAKITTFAWTEVAVHKEGTLRAVTNQNGAVETCLSSDIDRSQQQISRVLFLKCTNWKARQILLSTTWTRSCSRHYRRAGRRTKLVFCRSPGSESCHALHQNKRDMRPMVFYFSRVPE